MVQKSSQRRRSGGDVVMLYRIKLPEGTKVGTKFIYFDHWVSVRAKNEWEAKNKAVHKLAHQMLHGDKKGKWSEPCFVFSSLTIKNIKADIDIADMEVYTDVK